MSNNAFSDGNPAGNKIACIHTSLQSTREENYKGDEYKGKRFPFICLQMCGLCAYVLLLPLGKQSGCPQKEMYGCL